MSTQWLSKKDISTKNNQSKTKTKKLSRALQGKNTRKAGISKYLQRMPPSSMFQDIPAIQTDTRRHLHRAAPGTQKKGTTPGTGTHFFFP
jgi:hypothetical protein